MAMTHPTGQTRTRALGFSLVEIMVAVLIGLIGSVVIFQVFAVSERQKRTTTGGADAAQGGLLALYSIERDARMAGFGINHPALLGCNVLAYDAGPPVRNPIPAFSLAAVRITDGASGAPDRLTFMYGDSSMVVAPVRLNSASNAGSTVHRVNIRFGFTVGDLILVGNTASPGTSCTLQQITRLPDDPTDEIEHADTARYNLSTIAGQPNYPPWSNSSNSGGVLYNLGPAPSVITYDVANGQLRQLNLLASATPVVIMDGIVQLQAEYGKDTTTDGTVDTYNTTPPANAVQWAQVLALRVALLSRSAEFDKAHCNANPQWIRGDGTAADFVMTNADGTADTGAACVPGTAPAVPDPNNWRQYRYRVFETTIPLRNLIWFPLA